MTSETKMAEIRPAGQFQLHLGSILAWLGLISLLALLFFGLQKAQKGQMKIGEKAPDFSLTTFDGMKYSSSDLKGKVVLVNIWASWCVPCKQEAPDLEEAWRTYKSNDDVLFLGVAWTDTDKKSAEYLREFDITYPNGPDLGTRIYQAFRATGVPETYVIDRNGILSYVKISPFLSVDEIRQIVDTALEKK